jgi:hypothetical protein
MSLNPLTEKEGETTGAREETITTTTITLIVMPSKKEDKER